MGQKLSSGIVMICFSRVVMTTPLLPSTNKSTHGRRKIKQHALLETLPHENVKMSTDICVSVILPVYNASGWLSECLSSVAAQTQGENFKLELSIYNDGSTDDSENIINNKWQNLFMENNITVVYSKHSGPPRGVGYAKNQAVRQSSGSYLCFLDSDDVMFKDRVKMQLQLAVENPNSIVGCKFVRDPPDSTYRFTNWANNLPHSKLAVQIYTSHGPTVIMPTWFCARSVFDTVGGFSEQGKGTPEDLMFFYQHLDHGGKVHRVDETLMMYRYHPSQTTFSIHETTIMNLRLARLEKMILPQWPSFTIWNAGKQGRQLYRALSPDNQAKVLAFCDVDAKKISQGVYVYENSPRKPKPRVPIVHFTQASPPFIICVKMDLTQGGFEANLSSLQLTEGKDYIMFS